MVRVEGVPVVRRAKEKDVDDSPWVGLGLCWGGLGLTHRVAISAS